MGLIAHPGASWQAYIGLKTNILRIWGLGEVRVERWEEVAKFGFFVFFMLGLAIGTYTGAMIALTQSPAFLKVLGQ